MYEIKFAPPVDVTEQQAQEIYDYMKLYYRMWDALEIINEQRNDAGPEQVAFYDNASDDEQENILKRIAVLSYKYQDDYDYYWRDAVECAFCEIKEKYETEV